MGLYDVKPERFLELRFRGLVEKLETEAYCAGFEMESWRCKPFSMHLMEWLPDYALAEDELRTDHGNAFVKLQQAASRVYTTIKHNNRGEAGEIALHAICRDFFGTIPISPRVFFKSASNDVIKSFDLVHARFPKDKQFEIWLGESKLYTDASAAVSDAIQSISDHIDRGFLTNQKLLLGPQIPKSTPQYEEILKIFKSQASLDKFLAASVFVVGILCDSAAAKTAKLVDAPYTQSIKTEIEYLAKRIIKSGLASKITMSLIYVPLASKDDLVNEFDKKLKGLQ